MIASQSKLSSSHRVCEMLFCTIYQGVLLLKLAQLVKNWTDTVAKKNP